MSSSECGLEAGPLAGRFLQRATDLAMVGLVFAAANDLAHWRLDVGEVIGILAVWGTILAMAEGLRPRWQGWAGVLEVLGPATALWGLNRMVLARPLAPAELWYLAALAVVAVGVWRLWCRRSPAVRAAPLAERARVLLLLALAGWAVLPFFTDRQVGGTDARWYASMLQDFIEQWRVAGPPVFIGQGEFAWNGGVHPFRSAPILMHVAGVWDWLTFGSLEVTALLHLPLITSALTGTLVTYAAGVSLAPRRRWEVASVAALYVLAPGCLMPGVVGDAYMTYMTFAVLPLVFLGNARMLLTRGSRGGAPLAAGLALVWMSHPPVALIATLVTLCLQVALLAAGPLDWGPGRSALRAGLLFLALSVCYFAGMAELPRPSQTGMGRELLQLGGAALVAGGVYGVLLSRRHGSWGLVAGLGFLLLWRTSPPWLGWLAATAALLGMVVMAARRWRWFEPADYAPLLMVACLMAAAAGTGAWLDTGQPWRNEYLLAALRENQALAPGMFLPLSPAATVASDFQPGPGLWLAGLVGLSAALRGGRLAAQCLFGTTLLLACFLVRIPGVSDFLTGYFPLNFAATSGILMFLRNMPVLCGSLAMAALLWLQANNDAPTVRWHRIMPIAGWVLVVWAAHDALKISRRGWAVTATRELTRQGLRTENAVLNRFGYDLLPHPATFSHGKMDPRLEIRFTGLDGRLLAGPDTTAREMEAGYGTQHLRLTATVDPNNPRWLRIEPGFTLAPGEHRLLRFEFAPDRRHDGVLILQSEHGYREYILPQSGLDHAFGTGPGHSRVLSLWNSGSTPEHYEISLQCGPENDVIAKSGFFAEVHLSAFDPARASLRVESLRPWRAGARVEVDGWLTTPRVFLPGYEVTVDGRVPEIRAGPDGSLQVRLVAGEHRVELVYRGTRTLRLAGGVSVTAWLGLLAWGWWTRNRVTAGRG